MLWRTLNDSISVDPKEITNSINEKNGSTVIQSSARCVYSAHIN